MLTPIDWETTREENRRRMMVTSILYLCSAIGMAAFSVLNSKRLKAELAGSRTKRFREIDQNSLSICSASYFRRINLLLELSL